MSVKNEKLNEVSKTLLTSECQMVDKTIKAAGLCGVDEVLVIKFTDGSAIVFKPKAGYHSDYMEMIIDSKPDMCEAKEWGLITQAEYDELQQVEQDHKDAENERRERAQLARLQQKYQS